MGSLATALNLARNERPRTGPLRTKAPSNTQAKKGAPFVLGAG